MRHPLVGIALLAVGAVVLSAWDCGSESPPDGGPPAASNCNIQAAFSGPCAMTLSGAVNFGPVKCTPIYAVFDPVVGGPGSTSMVQIGAPHTPNPNGGRGLAYVNVTLKWTGQPPASGPVALTPASTSSKPNNVIIGLDDPVTTIYQGVYPSNAMQFTVRNSGVGAAPDGGASSLWCVDGDLSADTTDIYNPSSTIHLELSFDAGI